jgi:hypothetical protein
MELDPCKPMGLLMITLFGHPWDAGGFGAWYRLWGGFPFGSWCLCRGLSGFVVGIGFGLWKSLVESATCRFFEIFEKAVLTCLVGWIYKPPH